MPKQMYVIEKLSTSQKHRKFVAEPIDDKSVQDIPGIGKVLGRRLTVLGFNKAYVLLGQYFFLRKKERRFKKWLKRSCNANAKQQRDCYLSLKEWSDRFVF